MLYTLDRDQPSLQQTDIDYPEMLKLRGSKKANRRHTVQNDDHEIDQLFLEQNREHRKREQLHSQLRRQAKKSKE